MQSRVFVDTLFVIALINQRDQHHQQASQLADIFAGLPVLITDAVLLEIGNGLGRSHKREAIAAIEHLLTSAEAEVVRLTPELFDRAFSLYKTHQDKGWGLVDCISFVAMWEAGVTRALTFDRHFVQAGFQALMDNTRRR